MDTAQENRFVWLNMEADHNAMDKLGYGCRNRMKSYRVYYLHSQNI